MISKRIMIIPVGEQIEPLIRGIRFYKEIDEIFLLHSHETEKEANKICRMIENLKIVEKIYKIKCMPADLASVISSLVEKLTNYNNAKIIVNLTGGTKIMSLGCYIFANLYGGECFYIFKKDKNMVFIEVPPIKNNIIEKIKNSKKRSLILLTLNKTEKMSIKEASKIFNLKSSTISYYFEELLKEGLLIKENKKYKISTLGKLVAELIKKF